MCSSLFHLKIEIANVLELIRVISQGRPLDDEEIRKVPQDLPSQRQRLCPAETLHKHNLAFGVDEEDSQQERRDAHGNTCPGTIA